MFAEWPAEHVPSPPPLASGVRHDALLLRENMLNLVMTEPLVFLPVMFIIKRKLPIFTI